MENIEIVFTKSKKRIHILSDIIKYWLNRVYSHVSRKLKPGFAENPAYYKASEGKVNYEIDGKDILTFAKESQYDEEVLNKIENIKNKEINEKI